VGTDRERQAFESLLDRGMTPEMIRGAQAIIKQELVNRKTSYEEGIARIRQSTRALTGGPTGTQAPPPEPMQSPESSRLPAPPAGFIPVQR